MTTYEHVCRRSEVPSMCVSLLIGIFIEIMGEYKYEYKSASAYLSKHVHVLVCASSHVLLATLSL